MFTSHPRGWLTPQRPHFDAKGPSGTLGRPTPEPRRKAVWRPVSLARIDATGKSTGQHGAKAELMGTQPKPPETEPDRWPAWGPSCVGIPL